MVNYNKKLVTNFGHRHSSEHTLKHTSEKKREKKKGKWSQKKNADFLINYKHVWSNANSQKMED